MLFQCQAEESLFFFIRQPQLFGEGKGKQFALKEPEREAVVWAWPQEVGDTLFHVVNMYTRAAAMEGLPAESGYRLQKVGGEVLGML